MGIVSGAVAWAKDSGNILSVLKVIFFAECFAPTVNNKVYLIVMVSGSFRH